MKVRDASGILSVRFFHGAYLEGRLKPGTSLVLHGKVDMDPYRTSRREMINPQIEVLSANQESASADSTEVGRIVPIYEAIGGISSRMIRRLIYGLLQNLGGDIPETLPPELLSRYGLPSRREALMYVHFPPANEDLEMLNSFRSPAHARMIFEEFFFFQLGIAARRKQERERDRNSASGARRSNPLGHQANPSLQAHRSAKKSARRDRRRSRGQSKPMSRLLEGDVGSGKTIVAFEAAVIAMENGCQVAIMAPTEILAVQHYLSARRIFKAAGYRVEILVSGMKRSEKLQRSRAFATARRNLSPGRTR